MDVISSRSPMSLSKGETKRLEQAVAFQTASGDTPSTHVAAIFFGELNETVGPYVLKDSVGHLSRGSYHEQGLFLHLGGWM